MQLRRWLDIYLNIFLPLLETLDQFWTGLDYHQIKVWDTSIPKLELEKRK